MKQKAALNVWKCTGLHSTNHWSDFRLALSENGNGFRGRRVDPRDSPRVLSKTGNVSLTGTELGLQVPLPTEKPWLTIKLQIKKNAQRYFIKQDILYMSRVAHWLYDWSSIPDGGRGFFL